MQVTKGRYEDLVRWGAPRLPDGWFYVIEGSPTTAHVEVYSGREFLASAPILDVTQAGIGLAAAEAHSRAQAVALLDSVKGVHSA